MAYFQHSLRESNWRLTLRSDMLYVLSCTVFNMLMDEANAWAKNMGMTEEDVNEAINEVRKNRRDYRRR